MAGRSRSGFSIFNKILKAESAAEHGRIGNPSNIVSQVIGIPRIDLLLDSA